MTTVRPVAGGTDMTSAVTRRKVLQLGGLAGLGGLLASCGSSDAPGAATTTSTATTSSSDTTSGSGASGSASSSTADPSTAGTGPVSLDDATRSTLDAVFQKAFASTGIAGMAATVRIGGAAWSMSAGSADLTTSEPYRPGDHVRIASITKSFTATAVLQLVDAGALSLQDPLEKFVPGIANGAQITVQNLLAMKSGIFDFTSDQAFLAKFDATPTMPWTDADTLAVIKAHEPVAAPGTTVAYCDSNYALLGMVIAAVTGKPAGAVITGAVVDALDLPGTSYPTDTTIPDPHPVGYVPGGDVADPNAGFDNAKNPPAVVTELNPAVASTAGAMISTLDDLVVWGAELASGSLLTPETQALRLRSERFPGVPINLGYGLGCEVLNDIVGHNGAILGFSSVVMRNPKTDVTIAAVGNESTNFTTSTSTFSYEVIKSLFPDQWV